MKTQRMPTVRPLAALAVLGLWSLASGPAVANDGTIHFVPLPYDYQSDACFQTTAVIPTEDGSVGKLIEQLETASPNCPGIHPPEAQTFFLAGKEPWPQEDVLINFCGQQDTYPVRVVSPPTLSGIEVGNKRKATMVSSCPNAVPFIFFIGRGRVFGCPGDYYEADFLSRQCERNDKMDPEKTAGEPKQCPGPVGNPIDPLTGNKYQVERDFLGAGPFPLRFERHYNSTPAVHANDARIGIGWRHTYAREIFPMRLANPPTAILEREDGKVWYYTEDTQTGEWSGEADVTGRLTELFDGQDPIGFAFETDEDLIELYDVDGRLVSITDRDGRTHTVNHDLADDRIESVTDHFGRTMSFGYDIADRIGSVTDPEGNVYEYRYDDLGNLETVVYPDEDGDPNNNEARRYLYEENEDADPGDYPHALTGIEDLMVDESEVIRYATYDYDGEGRGILTEHAGGADSVTFTYNVDGTTTVTDALGGVSTYGGEVHFGVPLITSVSAPCAFCGSQSSAATYDANGFPASRTDFNGNVTNLTFDDRGLEESRTEAVGAPDERTITTAWHAEYRVPTLITEPGRTTAFTHDSAGRVLTRTVTDTGSSASRTTTFTYTVDGLLETLDGPRNDVTDVTTFFYDVAGNLEKTENALGHETLFTDYDLNGRVLTIEDPNGLITDLLYDARGRLESRTVGGNTTSFLYELQGNVDRVTLPDGSFLEFEYDDAKRLEVVRDNLGNEIRYTLDALGNRTGEEVYDDTETLERTLSRVYNDLNRLVSQTGGAGQFTQFDYDPQGNRILVTDPKSQSSTYEYDALNRLVLAIDPQQPENGETGFEYNALDQLIEVTDPEGQVTEYQPNAFGEVEVQISPDTGTTTRSYEAGNLKTETDARGITQTLAYDALNRLTSIS